MCALRVYVDVGHVNRGRRWEFVRAFASRRWINNDGLLCVLDLCARGIGIGRCRVRRLHGWWNNVVKCMLLWCGDQSAGITCAWITTNMMFLAMYTGMLLYEHNRHNHTKRIAWAHTINFLIVRDDFYVINIPILMPFMTSPLAAYCIHIIVTMPNIAQTNAPHRNQTNVAPQSIQTVLINAFQWFLVMSLRWQPTTEPGALADSINNSRLVITTSLKID